jgi:hypothetical protein
MSFAKQIFQPCSPRLTEPKHYLDVLEKNSDSLQELSLVDVTIENPFLHLTYCYDEELSHSEADVVDTRLRAYIACAIFDAATGLFFCQPAPSHGSRPAWFIQDCPVPFSLLQGRYNVKDKSIYLTVGPIIPLPQASGYTEALAEGFIKRFRIVKV